MEPPPHIYIYIYIYRAGIVKRSDKGRREIAPTKKKIVKNLS